MIHSLDALLTAYAWWLLPIGLVMVWCSWQYRLWLRPLPKGKQKRQQVQEVRTRYLNWLQGENWFEHYQRILISAIKWYVSHCHPATSRKTSPLNNDLYFPPLFATSRLSAHSYLYSLRLATFFPWFFLMGGWLLGSNGLLDVYTVFPTAYGVSLRLLFLGLGLLGLWLFMLSDHRSGWLKTLYLLPGGLAVVIATLLAMSEYGGLLSLFMPIVCLFAVISYGDPDGWFLAYCFSFAMGMSVGISAAVTGTAALPGTAVYISCFVASFAVLVLYYSVKDKCHTESGRVFLIMSCMALLLGITVLGYSWAAPRADKPLYLYFLFFICLIPPFIALCVWLALAKTHSLFHPVTLTQKGMTGDRFILRCLLDVLLGLVAVILLASLLVLVSALVNAVAYAGEETPVIALTYMLDEIRAMPGNADYYWIYLVFMLPFMPTLIQAGMIGMAMMISVVNESRQIVLASATELAAPQPELFRFYALRLLPGVIMGPGLLLFLLWLVLATTDAGWLVWEWLYQIAELIDPVFNTSHSMLNVMVSVYV